MSGWVFLQGITPMRRVMPNGMILNDQNESGYQTDKKCEGCDECVVNKQSWIINLDGMILNVSRDLCGCLGVNA
jgi:hypothetical protein